MNFQVHFYGLFFTQNHTSLQCDELENEWQNVCFLYSVFTINSTHFEIIFEILDFFQQLEIFQFM